MAKHYVRLGSDSSTITHAYSDAFETFQSGDVLVEETDNRHYQLEVKDALGFYCKKWTGSAVADMSQAEIDATEVNRDNRINAKSAEITNTDKKIIRVIEDLITILISKGTIQITDFPQVVQDKIAERQALRTELNNL